ncbi:virulence factor SrfB [Lonepinella sp. BR2474]|uniref:virulence factor SrfB n=1 Tax=Lonepinella sp. BR2474 TaxID=3434548 RepID=UPI003F6E3B85
MYPELHHYNRELTLIMDSGIQFIDFGLKIDWKDKAWREKGSGYFVFGGDNAPLRRLILAKNGEGYCDTAKPDFLVNPKDEISVEQSFTLFDGIWLPIPVLRSIPPDRFDEGPYNWSRARIVKLEEPDEEGNTHRVTVAFDTKIFPNNTNTAYLAPTTEDVRAGGEFALAHQSNQMSWFLDYKWVNDWLIELYQELAAEPTRLKLYDDDIEDDLKNKRHQGHYLNILSILGTELDFPKIRIVSNQDDGITKPIPVDMVLDVGNSRTCGILIENHEQEHDGLSKRYELEIRDLSKPEHIYNEPFESRVEFSQAFFGKEHFSVQSGRRDAFQWATIGRIGREANRLASLREGNEGATGLSSPKRYLWDEAQYGQGWRFNTSYVKSDSEPYATAEPLSGLINEWGEPLHTLSDDNEEEFERKMPVFQPKYSRSSLMTFMLSEVLMHALMQMNSPTQRYKLEHAKAPRYLRSIILTVPPAMPRPERAIFEDTMENAIGLVWKCLGWDSSDDKMDFSKEARDQKKYWPQLPEVHIQWDEATCGQVVYLFNETQNNYSGRPEEFIAAMVRPDKAEQDKSKLRIATIDIGGGTTDLVINDYSLDYGDGQTHSSNVYIVPEQKFRDGFKVAGDDILLEIIQRVVLKALSDGLKNLGLRDPEPVLSRLLAAGGTSKVQDEILRQQLTLQVFNPIGLRILKEYENYDPYTSSAVLPNCTFESLLSEVDLPTQNVLNYINVPIQRELGQTGFDILQLPISVDWRQIHYRFICDKEKGAYDICNAFNSMSEIVNLYQCDVLLLTGRPSRLPGVQAFFRSRVPLPVGRILPLYHYHTGTWYPFHKQGRIEDPKTTAAVGAMLCMLSHNQRLPNFYFRASYIKAYSTIRYIGLLDKSNMLKQANVYYKDVDLDNPQYLFPETVEFEVRGPIRLGFRQLNVERWPAAPLYTLTIENPDLRRRIAQDGMYLKVALKAKEVGQSSNKTRTEQFEVKSLSASDDRSVNRFKDIKLTLNTMTDAGLGSKEEYWLDSGVVKR